MRNYAKKPAAIVMGAAMVFGQVGIINAEGNDGTLLLNIQAQNAGNEIGTEANPFKIGSEEVLKDLATKVNNDLTYGTGKKYSEAYYQLTGNIDLTGEWTPIGTEKNKFTGVFDGQNHTVSNLKISNGSDNQGLFGYVSGDNALIKDLNVSNANISAGKHVGIVAGYNQGTILNCTSSGTVKGTQDNVGGITGITQQSLNGPGVVLNCTNTATVTGSTKYIGGIVGNYQGIVSSCQNTGNVTGKDYVGGISGHYWRGGVYNCIVSSCNISSTESNKGRISGDKDSLYNNYADDTVTVNGSAISDPNVLGKNSINGETVTTITKVNLNIRKDGNTWNQEFKFNKKGDPEDLSNSYTSNNGIVCLPDETYDIYLYDKKILGNQQITSTGTGLVKTATDLPMNFYTVSFDTQNSAASIYSKQTLLAGEKVDKTAIKAPKGYKIDGYYKDDQYKTEWDFDADTITNTTTIYVKLSKIPTPPGDTSSPSYEPSKPLPPKENKLVGENRFETASKISNMGWTQADNMVLVNSDAMTDALTATPLAKQKDAPILLTENNKLSDETKKEIARLKVKNVYIIGGLNSVSEKVISELKGLKVKVERISGDDRYQTSVKIAEKLGNISEIAVVNGETGISDAVSIAPVAASKNMPIILSSPTEGLNESDKLIKSKEIKTSYVIGKENSISNDIATKLPNNKRIGGENRNETNANIIETFYTNKNMTNAFVAKDGMNKQDELIDALAVGVLASKQNSPVVIVGNKLEQKQQKLLSTKVFEKLTQVGGNGNENAFIQLKNLFK